VIVEVTIPADAADGEMDTVTITATSEGSIVKTSELTTTVVVPIKTIWMPVILTPEE
jgi:hypothetical protein